MRGGDGCFVVIGLKHGQTEVKDKEAKEKAYALVRDFADRFRTREGTLLCRELLDAIWQPGGMATARQKGYFTERCPGLSGRRRRSSKIAVALRKASWMVRRAMSGIALGIVWPLPFSMRAGTICSRKATGRSFSSVVPAPVAFLLSSGVPLLLSEGCDSSCRLGLYVATGLIHAAYFWFMGGAYQRGDLSMVYPLARGSGPLFVPILAMVLLREEVSALGMAGIALIVGGIYCVHLRAFSASAFLEPFRALRGGASLWALLTGLSIAAYTLVDKVGVALVYPVVYIYGMFLITWLTLTPWILLRERSFLAAEWRRHTGPIFIVGFLSGFTYLMVLFALQISKVSYVAAVREVSIILSAYLGIVWLGEKHGRQKLVGAILTPRGLSLSA
jgi:uncharacterized membrane protein